MISITGFEAAKTLHKVETLLAKIPNEKIICACSGGVDSMLLATVLAKYFKEIHFITVNHNFRKEAKEEALKVSNYLKTLGHTSVILNWKEGRNTKIGFEEKARKARQNLIFSYAIKHKIKFIFLGHNNNDRLETFFLKLASGASVLGLNGLKSVNSYTYEGNNFLLIRPFIALSKSEIYKEAKLKNLLFFEDETNKNQLFTRNRIRANLPNILKQIDTKEENIENILFSIELVEKALKSNLKRIFQTLIFFENTFGFFYSNIKNISLLSVEELLFCLKKILFYFNENTDFRTQELLNACNKIKQKQGFTVCKIEVFWQKDNIYFIKEAVKIKNEIKFDLWDLRFKIKLKPGFSFTLFNKALLPKTFNLKLPYKILKTLPIVLKDEKFYTMPEEQNLTIKVKEFNYET